jgi:hypothetical protein
MEDLTKTLSAEVLSDEVLTEITEQLEQTSSENAREELFTRIAKKYNMEKEVVLKHFLKFIQDGFEDQGSSESIGEETIDDYEEDEFSSGNEDLYAKTTIKIDRNTKSGVFTSPKMLIARRKSRSHGIKPLIIGQASKEVPFGSTRRQECQKCGNICETKVSDPTKVICAECVEVEKSIKATFPNITGDQIAVSRETAANFRTPKIQEKFSSPRESAEILCPPVIEARFIPEGAGRIPVASARDFIQEAGWTHEEALRLVDDLVVNYTAHILNPQHLSEREVEAQLRESMAVFHTSG